MLRQLKINDREHLNNEMQGFNVDPAGISIMLDKGEFFSIKTSPLPAAGCNILKQQMLSIGGEVAISKGSANCAIHSSPAIIFGTKKQFRQLLKSLEYQCFGLKELQQELKGFLASLDDLNIFKIGEKTFDLSKKL
jgi:dihydropteroate synthase